VTPVVGVVLAHVLSVEEYGVYAVGHTALTSRSRYLAAVLACGEGALASHRTAAGSNFGEPVRA